MKGLEATVLPVSSLENLITIGSEYYLRTFVEDQTRLHSSGLPLERLSSVCSLITDGDHGIADYQDDGIPFILSENVKDGWIDVSALRMISEAHHKTLKRSQIKPGDVLVTKTGVYFGKSAVFDSQLKEANTIAHVGIIRPKKHVNQYLLSAFFNSRYGQSQLRRRGIKATRPEIKLVEFQDIEVPVFSSAVAKAVQQMMLHSKRVRAEVDTAVLSASQTLIRAIGLADWTPPEPLTYTASMADVFASGRLDARFFAPRIQALLDLLSANGRTVSDVADQRRERFQVDASAVFDYIEIGDVDGTGAATDNRLNSEEAPSRATWHVREGDIITSTVRPIRRLSAQIAPEQDGFVCSSGFVVVTPREIAPEVLLTYLRLPLICELLDLYASASMYPAIADSDIFNLPMPYIPGAVAEQVTQAVIASRAKRARAVKMLETAKRAVELAIEDGESAALAYLEHAEGAT